MWKLRILFLLLINDGEITHSERWYKIYTGWSSISTNEITSVSARNVPDCGSKVSNGEAGFAFNQSEKSCHLLQCVNPNMTYDNVSMSDVDLYLRPANYSLARGKAATMSSTHVGSSGYTYGADNAVDGIYLPDGVPEPTSTVHSGLGDNNPWWRVDLEQVYCVWGVNILNRAYIYTSAYRRNKDVEVTVARDETQLSYDTNPDSRCNYFDGPLNQYYTLIGCIQPMRGQFVQIQYRASSNTVINLYEIEVFGV